jgi:hypothetical protein
MFARIALICARDLRAFECPACDRSQQDIARLDFNFHLSCRSRRALEGLS